MMAIRGLKRGVAMGVEDFVRLTSNQSCSSEPHAPWESEAATEGMTAELISASSLLAEMSDTRSSRRPCPTPGRHGQCCGDGS